MKNNPPVLDHSFFVAAVVFCALREGLKDWMLAASVQKKLIAFSPPIIVGAYAVLFSNLMFMILPGALVAATIVVTGAKDKLGMYFSEKFENHLKKVEAFVREVIHIVAGSPYVVRVQLPRTDIYPSFFPVELPPPRTHLAGKPSDMLSDGNCSRHTIR